MRVLVIPWDGPARMSTVTEDPAERLREMQALVEGLIEAIDLEENLDGAPPATMWVNEEGMYLCADQPNALALIVRNQYAPEHARWNPRILGSVFVSGFDDETGECRDVPAWVVESVNRMAGVLDENGMLL